MRPVNPHEKGDVHGPPGHVHDPARHDDAHHEHAHGHHAHGHEPVAGLGAGRSFAVGIALNVGFVVIETFYGVFADSTALLADAGHNLSDVLGLAVAWVAVVLGRRPPTPPYTYGLRQSSILAALFNALFLLVAVGGIAWEAVRRFAYPAPAAGTTMMAVAAAGIVVNGFTAWLFAAGRREDLNVRAAYLHMLADTAVSGGVVVAGFLIALTGRTWIDPLVGLVIVAVILWSTWRLLLESLSMSLAAVPPGISSADVETFLLALPGVSQVHDLHIWPLSTTDTALTCHLVIPGGYPGDAFLADVAERLEARFRINHSTIQIETVPEANCRLAPAHVI